MALLGIILSIVAVNAVFLAVFITNPDCIYNLVNPLPTKQKAFPYKEQRWTITGREKPPGDEVLPFKVHIPEEQLQDLHRRLNATKFIPALSGPKFDYGFNSNELRKIVAHWIDRYDWRQEEAKINQHPHYRTNIEGLDIHFVRIKPTSVDRNTDVYPIVMFHGWPGSFFEMWYMLPHLLQPKKLPNGRNVALEIILPSLPGFGFSDKPETPGMDVADMTRIMAALMQRLGFSQYFVHGYDWGAVVGRFLSIMYPERVLGFNTPLYPVLMNTPFLIKSAVAMVFPSLMVSPGEERKLLFKHIPFLLGDFGFGYMQITKPDTVSSALTDSPAGLAAWILDKQVTQTRPYENIYKDDGGLKEAFDRDQLLTNIMIFWWSNSIGSSVRLYKECCGYFGCDSVEESRFRFVVPVPTLLSDFRDEVPGMQPPDDFAKRYFDKLISVNKHIGGHFMAMEKPAELSEDIWQLVLNVTAAA